MKLDYSVHIPVAVKNKEMLYLKGERVEFWPLLKLNVNLN